MKDVDPQRQLVYAMEYRELRGHRWHRANFRDLRKRARVICRIWGVPRVGIIARKEKGCGASYNSTLTTDTIWLGPDAMNYLLLAHELAHHIVWTKHPKAQDHGPTWVFYYGQILQQLRVVPEEGFIAICRRHGVKRAAKPKPRRR